MEYYDLGDYTRKITTRRKMHSYGLIGVWLGPMGTITKKRLIASEKPLLPTLAAPWRIGASLIALDRITTSLGKASRSMRSPTV